MPTNPPQPKESPSIRSLFPFLKPYTVPISATMVFLIAGRVASTLQPVWLKKIIDGITTGQSLAAVFGLIVLYFALGGASALADFMRDLIFAPTEMGISRTLSQELFQHLLNLQVSYHAEQKIGGTSRKITRGARAVTFILDFLVINILPTILELIITTALLLALYPAAYGIITFVTIVTYTLFTIWATEKRQKFRIAANEADDEVSGLEVDSLANIETVKYFNNEPVQLERYQPLINRRYSLSVTSNQLFAVVAFGQAAILLVGLGAVLVLAVRQTVAHTLTVGDLVLLTSYIARLAAPIGVLGFIYRSIKDGMADIEGMAQMLKTNITVPEPVTPTRLPEKALGELQFKHTSFHYQNERQVLKDIDFTVEPGKKIAFVGPSGAGKSTIVKLLFRLFDPTEGSLTIDGVDLREVGKIDRQRLFAIVPQEPILFNTTIAENIRFGKPDATDEEIAKAAELASIRNLIESLPDKYETMVGERGVKLSGGEKQRVAIARAVIRDPKVLVFDEATSSLDSTSEQEILTALETAAKGRTTIAVAHRLSTIANSDVIYVLDKGQVVEQGTHGELLAKNGLYAKLWKIQAETREYEK